MWRQRRKTAIAFDNWKYKHYFEFIWSKSKNNVVQCTLCAENKTFQLSLFNLGYLKLVINYLWNKAVKVVIDDFSRIEQHQCIDVVCPSCRNEGTFSHGTAVTRPLEVLPSHIRQSVLLDLRPRWIFSLFQTILWEPQRWVWWCENPSRPAACEIPRPARLPPRVTLFHSHLKPLFFRNLIMWMLQRRWVAWLLGSQLMARLHLKRLWLWNFPELKDCSCWRDGRKSLTFAFWWPLN